MGRPLSPFIVVGARLSGAHSIQLLDIEDDGMRVMTSFVTPALFSKFDLLDVLSETP